MHSKIIKGSFADKNLLACYMYLKEKYRREKLRDRNLCTSEHRGTSEERLQPERSD
ncbi:hypothetical protein D1872_165160 [compost metagenome]|nr:hypothetical protein AMI01nite_17460 [Aneurinibacillus migulanus]